MFQLDQDSQIVKLVKPVYRSQPVWLKDKAQLRSKTVNCQILNNVRSQALIKQFVKQKTVTQPHSMDVNCLVVDPVLSVEFTGPPQKKGVRPARHIRGIKLVKDVSCVDPCLLPQVCLML